MKNTELSTLSTRAPEGYNKEEGKEALLPILTELDELQNLLYASNQHAVLIIVQGLDASGKDSLTRSVFGQMNPQGVQVTSFKVPTTAEASHDFLWRVHKAAPARGMIRIFNRSQYEDVLVPSVHGTINEKEAEARMKAINHFERLLINQGNTHILKIFLHVSADEQKERIKERLEDPRKMWKYNKSDEEDMKLRDKYLRCYEDIFRECTEAPWHIIPADQKWYRNLLVATALRDMLRGLKMEYPTLSEPLGN